MHVVSSQFSSALSLAAFGKFETLRFEDTFFSTCGEDVDLGDITLIIVWRRLIVLKATSCSSSSSDVVLDSVEDSEESEAADIGRLGEQDSSVLPSFEGLSKVPEVEEFDT